jgi:peroxiredoxin Q/BCP
MLREGQRAPDFTLAADDGSKVSLKSLRGSPVVLFFYPKDNTPTCTVEVCDFRDGWQALERAGAVVLGVSPDGIASHVRFRQKYRLPFPLLADPDHAVAERYGAWGDKKLFGISYQGIKRMTFVIDAKGVLVKVFDKVRAKGHAAQVLAILQG